MTGLRTSPGADLAQPAYLDRQRDRSGHDLVRRPRRHHGSHPAVGI